ncbi:MAG: hypothetical protein AAFV29_03670, partial [Myxococcota bacterium]
TNQREVDGAPSSSWLNIPGKNETSREVVLNGDLRPSEQIAKQKSDKFEIGGQTMGFLIVPKALEGDVHAAYKNLVAEIDTHNEKVAQGALSRIEEIRSNTNRLLNASDPRSLLTKSNGLDVAMDEGGNGWDVARVTWDERSNRIKAEFTSHGSGISGHEGERVSKYLRPSRSNLKKFWAATHLMSKRDYIGNEKPRPTPSPPNLIVVDDVEVSFKGVYGIQSDLRVNVPDWVAGMTKLRNSMKVLGAFDDYSGTTDTQRFKFNPLMFHLSRLR